MAVKRRTALFRADAEDSTWLVKTLVSRVGGGSQGLRGLFVLEIMSPEQNIANKTGRF